MGWFSKDKDGNETGQADPPERSSLANLSNRPTAPPPPGQEADATNPAAGRPAPASSQPPAPAATGSVFAESVDIEGSLEGHGDVVLLGTVRGSIHVTGSLVIEASGRVQADVAAREVINAGAVEGNITAAERVRVAATGVVNGDIDAPSIVIDDGGGVEGFIQMEPPGGDDFDDEDDFVPPPPIKGLRESASPVSAATSPVHRPPPAQAGPATSERGPATPLRPLVPPAAASNPDGRAPTGPGASAPSGAAERSTPSQAGGNGDGAPKPSSSSPFGGDETLLSGPSEEDEDGPLVLGGDDPRPAPSAD